MRRAGRGADGDRGAVLVEFAIVLPLLAMLLLGMVTGGLALHQHQQISHAAREGARYGARVPPDQTFASGSWASNVRDIIVARAGGDLSGPGTSVCVSLVRGSAGGSIPLTSVHSTQGGPCIPTESFPVSTNQPGLRVQVVVSRPGVINLGPFSVRNFTIRSNATVLSEAVT
jgi:Flp pilus assembly protein TadG